VFTNDSHIIASIAAYHIGSTLDARFVCCRLRSRPLSIETRFRIVSAGIVDDATLEQPAVDDRATRRVTGAVGAPVQRHAVVRRLFDCAQIIQLIGGVVNPLINRRKSI